MKFNFVLFEIKEFKLFFFKFLRKLFRSEESKLIELVKLFLFIFIFKFIVKLGI